MLAQWIALLSHTSKVVGLISRGLHVFLMQVSSQNMCLTGPSKVSVACDSVSCEETSQFQGVPCLEAWASWNKLQAPYDLVQDEVSVQQIYRLQIFRFKQTYKYFVLKIQHNAHKNHFSTWFVNITMSTIKQGGLQTYP